MYMCLHGSVWAKDGQKTLLLYRRQTKNILASEKNQGKVHDQT